MARNPDNLGRAPHPRMAVAPPSAAELASRAAVRLLKFKDRTRAELLGRLKERFGVAAAQAAVDSLEAAGLTGDRRVARVYAEQRLTGKLEASDMVRRTLRKRGVSLAEARAAVAGASDGRSDLARARELLERSRARFGTSDAVASRRRAFGLLARRGFDEDTAARAINDVLGAWREPEADEGRFDADV